MINKNNPIGIFDSGIGGLTVLKTIHKLLPYENIIYIGDSARLPYGSKTKTTIKKYSLEIAQYLAGRGVKSIVIACNTASAISTNYLRSFFSFPIIGVVESGALAALSKTKNKKIGIIGTNATIKSRAYSNAINKLDNTIEVFELATPILVSIVEENWTNKKVALEILKEYLDPLFRIGIDTLVLGCTHFPFLSDQIRVIAPDIIQVDSADNTAVLLNDILKSNTCETANKESAHIEVSLTDLHKDFQIRANKYLGFEIVLSAVHVENC